MIKTKSLSKKELKCFNFRCSNPKCKFHQPNTTTNIKLCSFCSSRIEGSCKVCNTKYLISFIEHTATQKHINNNLKLSSSPKKLVILPNGNSLFGDSNAKLNKNLSPSTTMNSTTSSTPLFPLQFHPQKSHPSQQLHPSQPYPSQLPPHLHPSPFKPPTPQRAYQHPPQLYLYPSLNPSPLSQIHSYTQPPLQCLCTPISSFPFFKKDFPPPLLLNSIERGFVISSSNSSSSSCCGVTDSELLELFLENGIIKDGFGKTTAVSFNEERAFSIHCISNSDHKNKRIKYLQEKFDSSSDDESSRNLKRKKLNKDISIEICDECSQLQKTLKIKRTRFYKILNSEKFHTQVSVLLL